MGRRSTWGVSTVGLAVVLAVAGCSGEEPGGPPSATPSTAPTGASASATPTPSAEPTVPTTLTPAVPATPSATTAAPATSAPPAPAAEPPAGITEPPRIPAEESAALGGFAACAQRYQERTNSLALGGAVTPVLLEQWSQAYEAASARNAEGDPVGAEQACLALQREMDAVLG